MRAAALRDRKVYLSLLSDAAKAFDAAKNALTGSAFEVANGKPYSMKNLDEIRNAYVQAELRLRYYKQLPDVYKAYKMGIEIPTSKFETEEDDVENSVLTQEAAQWQHNLPAESR